MFTKKIGNTDIEVSAMGIGCWAIGGPAFNLDGTAIGWGDVNDEDSVKGLHAAIDAGITLFDTSNMYGCGHSETLLGEALRGRRDRVVISTKFGWVFDAERRMKLGYDISPSYIRESLEGSLKRLQTDYIDVYFLHVPTCSAEETEEARDTLNSLVREGKIRTYGWSVDDASRAKCFAEEKYCQVMQFSENIFEDNEEMEKLIEEYQISGFNRSPLAMGVLTGKFSTGSRLQKNDIRGREGGSRFFTNGGVDAAYLKKVEAIREILTQGGRTPAQGALGWVWARSGRNIPIPGFKNLRQINDNVKALEFGPLSEKQMQEISVILKNL